MRRHLREEELRILRGEQQVDENDIDCRRDDNDDDDQGSSEEESDSQSPISSSKAPGPVRLARPGAADPRGRLDYPGTGQVIGSMLDDDDDDYDEEDSAEFNDQVQVTGKRSRSHPARLVDCMNRNLTTKTKWDPK
ncbi:hypothetical protein BVRB_021690, partial [Beta vulgaris subsp. vulgaris]